jgi:phage-related protein
MGSSRRDLRRFPESVRRVMGYALYVAQVGGTHPNAKALRGFGGGGVLEVVEDQRGEAYRAVYAVQLPGAVYVLHAFQKKSKKGARTPKKEMDLVRARLTQAERLHGAAMRGTEGSGHGPE